MLQLGVQPVMMTQSLQQGMVLLRQTTTNYSALLRGRYLAAWTLGRKLLLDVAPGGCWHRIPATNTLHHDRRHKHSRLYQRVNGKKKTSLTTG
jgi:hypothetical protein